jgi:hypothetical protein
MYRAAALACPAFVFAATILARSGPFTKGTLLSVRTEGDVFFRDVGPHDLTLAGALAIGAFPGAGAIRTGPRMYGAEGALRGIIRRSTHFVSGA